MAQPITFNRAVAITKSDTVDHAAPTEYGPMKGMWVGGAGIVVAVFADSSTANFTCTAGTVLPIECKRVNSTTTTATLMVALYQV
jgi:hypothetical protein